MNFRGAGWPDEEVELLRRLWTIGGLSAGQIVPHLPNRSRNAILGKLQRMGLLRTRPRAAPKPAAERKSTLQKRKLMRFNHEAIPKSVVPLPVALTVPEVVVQCKPVTLADRRSDQCGWPVNDGDPFLFCGAPKSEKHKNYCAHHEWVAGGRRRAA